MHSPAKSSQKKGVSRDCPNDQLIVPQVKASVAAEMGMKMI